MNKKAGFDLTVELIVVVIIAIFLLGLGLSFASYGDRKMIRRIDEVQKKDVIDRLRDVEASLALSEFEVDGFRGEKNTIHMMIRNDVGSDEVFSIMIFCTGLPGCDIWIDTFSEVTIKGNNSLVLPVDINIPKDAEKGSYLYNVVVEASGYSESVEFYVNVK